MRPCNNYQTTTEAKLSVSSRLRNRITDARSHKLKSHHVLFFFMCRSTCSHCWKKALALSKYRDLLSVSNTTVLLVGDGKYRDQAQQLVEDLNIPFRYIADNGALRRYYHVDSVHGRGCRWALLFVDDQGIIRFSNCGLQGKPRSDRALNNLADFLKELEYSRCRENEHIGRKPTVALSGI